MNGSGGDVRFAQTLTEALALAVEGIEAPDGGGDAEPPSGGEGSVRDQVAELLIEAEGHFAAAEAALRDGDLAEYQRQIALAQQAVEEAVRLAATADQGATEPSATPSASPSP